MPQQFDLFVNIMENVEFDYTGKIIRDIIIFAWDSVHIFSVSSVVST